MKLNIAKVIYADKSSQMATSIENIDFAFSGSVSEAIAKLKTKLDIKSLTFYMDKIPYLSKAQITADAIIDADLENNKYVFKENSIALNAIKANFDGFVHLVDSSTIDMDIKLNTPSIDFKQILSLIPAIYAKDFESIKTTGKVSLSAYAKGRMQGDLLPAFDAKLNVADAMFKYPDLPGSVDNINIDLQTSNPGGIADLTVVNVPVFKFNMMNNPFAAHLLLKTPISDPDFDFGANGTINFNKLKDVIPMDSIDLQGVFKADLNAKGKLSYVEQELYDKFLISGNLNLSDLIFKSADLPYEVKVAIANMNFSTSFIDLTDLKIALGKNDIDAKGKLENFIPYALKDETIKGSLTVNSTYFNLNDFMTEDSAVVAETSVDTSAMTVNQVQGNIDFNINVNFAQIIYDNII